jgi:hypothetical protein
MNPYQSPSTRSDPRSTSLPEATVRGFWLVRVSLLLAVVCEVAGADPAGFALANRDLRLYLIGRAIFLPAILFPLFVYIILNGHRGVIAAKGRIVLIAVIVLARLAFELVWLVSFFSG